jgi:hypothetical protein
VGLWDRIHQNDSQSGAEAMSEASTGPTIAEAVEMAHGPEGAQGPEAAHAPEVVRREVWGRPSACPKCGGHGYLDRIDVVDRVMFEHCTECFHKWQVAESETQKSNS